METKETSKSCPPSDQVNQKSKDEIEELLTTIPQNKHWNGLYICQYKGFWYPPTAIRSMIYFQRHFHATDTDIILATIPKSGTTWLKALTFSIVNRNKYTISQSPLLTTNPHELVRFFEFDVYMKDENPNLEEISCPRIFSTHLPYEALPSSILDSKCRLVHICRNPLDRLISEMHFILKNTVATEDALSLDEAFELFCDGIHIFGPFWDNVLGYWKASVKNPEKVLCLKYEDLKEDINSHVKKLAEFLGFPFSIEEEKQGLVEEISRLCSFENLKNLDVNKEGKFHKGFRHSSFFRSGKVGDWANFLSPSKAQRLQKIVDEKLSGSGLTLKFA